MCHFWVNERSSHACVRWVFRALVAISRAHSFTPVLCPGRATSQAGLTFQGRGVWRQTTSKEKKGPLEIQSVLRGTKPTACPAVRGQSREASQRGVLSPELGRFQKEFCVCLRFSAWNPAPPDPHITVLEASQSSGLSSLLQTSTQRLGVGEPPASVCWSAKGS